MGRSLVNGAVSFWHAELGGPPPPRAPLAGDITADVCIVGGGYTGLWTAWWLKRAEPALRVAVVEARFCGFGASGRNGGWLSGAFEWPRAAYAASHGAEGVAAMAAALAGTVDSVIDACAAEGIAADIRRTEQLLVATNPAQLARAAAAAGEPASAGGPAPARLLTASAVRDRIHVHDALGGLVLGGCARVQPARLVRGLAEAVERHGVALYEGTRALRLGPGEVLTDRGTIRAGAVIRATEGFTPMLPGARREWLPLNSAMIVTEPLPPALWKLIGWDGHELLGDLAHAYCYAQRTAGGRIAFGGRGIPYRYGSRLDSDGQTQPATIRQLRAGLLRLFPQLAGLRIAHAWCGALAVPRDWCPTVAFDTQRRMGWAGGYTGLGVATSHLAGQTLAELILGHETSRTALPWVNRTSPVWEPEPLRWLAVHGLYALYRAADRAECRTAPRTHVLAQLANRIAGR